MKKRTSRDFQRRHFQSGVFYPNKKPTQRIGIVPDVKVEPTIAGIRSGRNELLEEALRQVLRKSVHEDEIQKMAKVPAGN